MWSDGLGLRDLSGAMLDDAGVNAVSRVFGVELADSRAPDDDGGE